MHLHSFEIRNVRAISDLSWKAPASRSGWHVVIGDNGSGKSSLLRCLALALIGPRDAQALRQDWSEWLPAGVDAGKATLAVNYQWDDKWAGQGPKLKNYYPSAGVRFTRKDDKVELDAVRFTKSDPSRHLWNDKEGWFSASFGPFRRFTGGDKEAEKLFYSHPSLARHLSVFGENIALTECLEWLGKLKFEQLDGNTRSGNLLEEIKSFINQEGFLPHDVRFEEVDSKGVKFVDGNGVTVPVKALGDGFRSILSLCFELLRQMSVAWQSSSPFDVDGDGRSIVRHTGVVLIDEIDAHLHPTWQRRIGFWLTRHFPGLQFIVTTHSPLVCHAAEHGSIFRLPTPGSGEKARMVEGIEKDRLIFGSVLDAYGTELFGSDVSRSETSREKQTLLARLNQKALKAKLSAKEAKERSALQALFPASMADDPLSGL